MKNGRIQLNRRPERRSPGLKYDEAKCFSELTASVVYETYYNQMLDRRWQQ